MDALGEALQTTVSRWKCKFSAPLPLELYTSSNFIGLFVKEDSAEVLKKFAADFAAEAASKTGKLMALGPGNQKTGKERGREVWRSRLGLGASRSCRNATLSCSSLCLFAPFLKTSYCSAEPPERMSRACPDTEIKSTQLAATQ